MRTLTTHGTVIHPKKGQCAQMCSLILYWQGPFCDSIILWAKRGRVQQVRAGGIVVVLFCAALLLSNRWRLLRTFNPPAGTCLVVMRCHGNACGRRVCANRWSVLVVKGAGCPSCCVCIGSVCVMLLPSPPWPSTSLGCRSALRCVWSPVQILPRGSAPVGGCSRPSGAFFYNLQFTIYI